MISGAIIKLPSRAGAIMLWSEVFFQVVYLITYSMYPKIFAHWEEIN
jgi:hypothetical protein